MSKDNFCLESILLEGKQINWNQIGWRDEHAAKSKREKYLNDIYFAACNNYAVIKMFMGPNNRDLCYILIPNSHQLFNYLVLMKQYTWVLSNNTNKGIKTGCFDEKKHHSLASLLSDYDYNENHLLVIRKCNMTENKKIS